MNGTRESSLAPPTAGTASPDESLIDPYAALGVDLDASLALMQEMYWTRVTRLVEADRAGDPRARTQIEALNAALALLRSPDRKAAYDAEHVRAGAGTSVSDTPAQSTSRRWVLPGALLVALVVSVVLGAAFGAASAAVVLTGAGAVALATRVYSRRQQRHERDAIALLQLAPGASRVEIDLAYDTLTESVLARIRHDDNVIARLESLDHAYLLAVGALDPERSPAAPHASRSAWTSLWGAALWMPRMARRGAGSLRGALPSAAQRMGLLQQTGRRSSRRLERSVSSSARRLAIAGRAAASVATHASRRAMRLARTPLSGLARWGGGLGTRTRYDSPFPLPRRAAPSDLGLDVDRRIGGGPILPGLVGGVTTDDGDSGDSPGFSLVLQSAAGMRTIPIGVRPLRIGSASTCDLVLPAQEDIAPEHVFVWQREDDVILHVVGAGAQCTVNGVSVTWARLDDGDAVEIGSSKLRVAAAPSRAATVPIVPANVPARRARTMRTIQSKE